MPIDNSTPEEKLLKIIEGSKAPEPRKARPSFGGIKKQSPFKSISLKPIDLRHYFSLRSISKLIAVICVVLTIFFIFDFFKLNGELNNRFKKALLGDNAAPKEADSGVIAFFEQSFQQAREAMKTRNIFTALAVKPVELTPVQGDAYLISNLKLVGIIWSDSPQVMIEDIKQAKTYLLSTSEPIGEFTIKKILREKVVLGKEDKEWELR